MRAPVDRQLRATALGCAAVSHYIDLEVIANRSKVPVDAVAAALDATQRLAAEDGPPRAEEPPPAEVLDRLRENLEAARSPAVSGDAALRLAEAVRELAVRHGSPAVEHCIRLVTGVRELLDGLNP